MAPQLGAEASRISAGSSSGEAVLGRRYGVHNNVYLYKSFSQAGDSSFKDFIILNNDESKSKDQQAARHGTAN
jgi:hypothetical protein